MEEWNMNCPNCGKEVKADMASCPSCGAAISAVPAVAAEAPKKKLTMTPAKIATLIVGSALLAYILIANVIIPAIFPTAPLFMGFYDSEALSMEFTGTRVIITVKESGAAPMYNYTYSEDPETGGLSIAKGKFVVDYDPVADTITVAAGTLHRVY